MTLIEHVREAFVNAAENGCTFDGWSDDEIAVDMCTYDADIEQYDVEDVEEAVAKVRPEFVKGEDDE